jgi:hypothetical protein
VEGEVFVRCHTEAMDLMDMASADLSHFMEDVPTVLSLEQAVAAYPGAGAVVECSVAGGGSVVGGDKSVWLHGGLRRNPSPSLFRGKGGLTIDAHRYDLRSMRSALRATPFFRVGGDLYAKR